MKFFLISIYYIDKLFSPIFTAYYKSPAWQAAMKSCMQFLRGPIPEKMNFKVGLEAINFGAIASSSLTPILFINAPWYKIV